MARRVDDDDAKGRGGREGGEGWGVATGERA